MIGTLIRKCGFCKINFKSSKRQRLKEVIFCSPSCSQKFEQAKHNPTRIKLLKQINLSELDSRVCAKCLKVKFISEFNSKKNRLNSWCKPCFYQYQMMRWNARKIEAIKYLGGKCARCSIEGHPSIYDFHHLSDKDLEWTKLRVRSWSKIQKELDKCIVLCSNCHREEHLNLDLWPK